MIYFVECTGRIKIGYAQDVEARIRTLSTGSSHELNLLCVLEGSSHFERAIHRVLKPYRQRGEWFTDCDSVRDLMASLQREGAAAINFREPAPEIKKRSAKPDTPINLRDMFGDCPLKPALTRVEKCTERYFGEGVAAALRREREMGLPKGTIVNTKIRAYFSTERLRVAGVMHDGLYKTIYSLVDPVIESIFDEDGDPLDFEVIAPAVMLACKKFERGMDVLFASRDLGVLDLSGFNDPLPKAA